MGSFLQDIFLRFNDTVNAETAEPSCSGTLTQAVEHLVDKTYSRLRFLPSYSRRLRAPLMTAFRAIDELVEKVPGAILCSRAAFSKDPRVNAFFSDPKQLQEVFSQSEEIHELLDAEPEAAACWALLCMKKEEHRQLGMSLVGDRVRKDVMQTTVNFLDHRIFSPATSEEEARRSLKCCIFEGLLVHIQKRVRDEKVNLIELENRRDFLLAHLNRKEVESRTEMQAEFDRIEKTLAQEVPRLASLESRLGLVVEILEHPTRYVSGHSISIHLSRTGVKLDGDQADADNAIPLFEIRIASQGTRVAALVEFPRAELLPRQDFIRKADRFLAF